MSRAARRCALALLSFVLGMDHGVASAAPLSAPSLHWVRGAGAEACVAPRVLAEQVEALLGRPLARAADAEHSLEGRIDAREGGGFAVRIRVTDTASRVLGDRAFEQQGSDCRRLTPAIAFIIAVLIDPQIAEHGLPAALIGLFDASGPVDEQLLRELEQHPPKPAAAVVVEQRPEPQQALARAPVAEREPFRKVRERQLLLQAQLWAFEAPRLQLGIEAGLLGRVVSVLSLGGYIRVAPQLGPHAHEGAATVQLWSLEAGALVCAGQGAQARLRFQGCVGPLISVVRAVGDGLDEDGSGTLAQAGAAVLMSLRLRLSERWGLAASLQARVAAQAREFSYRDGSGEEQLAARVAPASVGLGLGPTFEF